MTSPDDRAESPEWLMTLCGVLVQAQNADDATAASVTAAINLCVAIESDDLLPAVVVTDKLGVGLEWAGIQGRRLEFNVSPAGQVTQQRWENGSRAWRCEMRVVPRNRRIWWVRRAFGWCFGEDSYAPRWGRNDAR